MRGPAAGAVSSAARRADAAPAAPVAGAGGHLVGSLYVRRPRARPRPRLSRRSRAASSARATLSPPARSPRLDPTTLSASQRQPSSTAAPLPSVLQRWSAASQTGRTSRPGAARELRHRLVEAVGAEAVAGAVRRLALDAVLPALLRAIHDGRRLTVVHVQGPPLRGEDLLEVVAVRHEDDVPVVQVEQLGRVPLDVVARLRRPPGTRSLSIEDWFQSRCSDDVASDAVPAAARASATRPGVRPPSPSMMCTRGRPRRSGRGRRRRDRWSSRRLRRRRRCRGARTA